LSRSGDRKNTKALVADTIDDITFNMGARKLLAQALGIALDLFGIFGLELKGGDGGLEFLLELGVRVILELNRPAQIGELLVVFADKFEIGL